jgi:hypothetical protein
MRPEFLTRPGVWVRSGSRSYDPIRDAYAIEHHKPANRADYVIAGLFIGFCLLMLLGVV